MTESNSSPESMLAAFDRHRPILFSIDHLRKAPPGFVVRRMQINGRLGLVGYFEDGSPHSVTTIDVARDKVRAIRLVVNPEKLGGVPPLGQAEIVEGPR